ncbi:MAG TPA: Kdo hydroxylase family protein [Caulobacteraceae bacterium]|nr:Kdo hydroxylase family protein [Caulobacteraceae bacterium]
MGSLAMGQMTPRASRERDLDAPTAVDREDRRFGEAGVVAVAGKPGRGDLRELLERDGVLIVETEPFQLTASELELIDRHWSDGRSKNSSYNPNTGDTVGVVGAPEVVAGLGAVMARYAVWSRDLIAEFFPPYHGELEVGRTSLRRRSVQDEPPLSRRKDDRSLHLDAFTSQPVAGRRILRVFNNVDPTGADREWAIAEGGFEGFAQRFRHRARRLLPGEAVLLESLSLTKCRRTDYDQIMLGMHDAAKRDRDYQATAQRRFVSFPAGATWLAFTDQTPHAAVSGQCALEQTFYVPVEALAAPASSPLRILERLWGAALV